LRRYLYPASLMTPAGKHPLREPWRAWISPETLAAQVANTAPYLAAISPAPAPDRLIALGSGPHGFLRILASWRNIHAPHLLPEEQLQDYFALCLACHHATVATFVPTDVDSKIRGLIWRESRDPGVLRPMLRLALEARNWSQSEISRREVRSVSGHNGEHWSVLAGALGRFIEIGDDASWPEALEAIEHEIRREQSVLDMLVSEPGAEIDLLMVAMSMAHNRGDLTQGISFWRKSAATEPIKQHLAEHGRFALAEKLYQETGLSAEGHRHYPLRPVKALRRSADTLLPLPPFLDDWGARVSGLDERVEVLEALVTGCRKIEGQQGYYRAIAGMQASDPRRFEHTAASMSNAPRKLLREPEMRKRLDVPRTSFESMMRKRARAALGRQAV
jgi:hypothetical protein